MGKNEIIWIVFRVIGIWLLILSMMQLPATVGSLYYMYNFNTELSAWSTPYRDGTKMINPYTGNFLISLFNLVLYAILSNYFLRKGKMAHNLIMNHLNQAKTNLVE